MPIGVYVALFGKLNTERSIGHWELVSEILLTETYYDLYGVYQDSNEYFPVA